MVEAGSEQQAAEMAERIAQLLAPLKQDKDEWEAQLSPDEKARAAAFEAELKCSPEKLQEFMAQVDATFTEADADADGKLTRDEFKAFTAAMDAHGVARGLKSRETTDELIDKVYPVFNAWDGAVDGVTKSDILTVLSLIEQ